MSRRNTLADLAIQYSTLLQSKCDWILRDHEGTAVGFCGNEPAVKYRERPSKTVIPYPWRYRCAGPHAESLSACLEVRPLDL